MPLAKPTHRTHTDPMLKTNRTAAATARTTVRGLRLVGRPGDYRLDGAPSVRFLRVGTYRVGQPGHRSTVDLWSVPGSQVNGMSLSAAVRKYQENVARAVCRAFYFGPR